MNAKSSDRRYLYGMVLAALGVVYGDIGTSPLYALRECFSGEHGIKPTPDHVLGVLSLIFWSLVLIVSVKYLAFVMRADNKGEGGILALLALAFPDRETPGRGRAVLIALGVFGAALLYGDGMITPAISVLSAVEGLNVATTLFDRWIIPITVVILIALFSFQRIGTGRVGKIFGPIMVVWFLTLALLGLKGIVQAPGVLAAFNPLHGLRFLSEGGAIAFVVLGSVFLVVTGGEALYADMGHFGVRPIRIAWFTLVLPALFLNYLGQGALLLKDPAAARNPFYLLAPDWALYPLVVLSTGATVIASQALISGAFSLTMQAIQLGYLPRLQIKHTSSDERGQIYLPQVNWLLMLAGIGLVLGFRSSSNLAAAYGIGVTLTMIIDSALFYVAARRLWNWHPLAAGAVCGTFLLIELSFVAANLPKITHGGWFPVFIGVGIFTFMATWRTGRRILRDRLQTSTLPMSFFLDSIRLDPPVRVPGTAVFMSGNPAGTPLALLHNLKHNKVLHQRVILLNITTADTPHVDPAERVRVEKMEAGLWRVLGRYGFMDEPNVPDLMRDCQAHGLEIKMMETTFFLSRETIISTPRPNMMAWREHLFAFMSRNAQSATAFFQLPANRVVELGMQVEI